MFQILKKLNNKWYICNHKHFLREPVLKKYIFIKTVNIKPTFYLGAYDGVLYLLERGVSPDGCLLNVIENVSNSENKTHLVKRLLERGADPDEEAKNKKSILTVAIKYNLTEIIQELMSHRADTNFEDENGVSSLAFAIQHGKLNLRIYIQNIVRTTALMKLFFYHWISKEKNPLWFFWT